MEPLRIYDYLILSRGRVMEAVRTLTSEQWGREFAFGLKSIGATVTHLMLSEWYYFERVEGRAVRPYEEWPIHYERPPVFEVVEAQWRSQQERIRGVIAAERDWNRRIAYESFADDAGRRYHISATAGDFFTQLALHEMHHRAQVLAMLRMMGDGVATVQDIDFNDLMFERREIK